MSTNLTATAPLVGRHHKKSNSLVGFDPLLKDEHVQDINGAASHADKKTIDDETREGGPSPPVSVNDELRLIASQLEMSSPTQQHLKSLTPPRPSRKMPWQKNNDKPGHRKTKSLASVSHFLWSGHGEKQSPKGSSIAKPTPTLTAPNSATQTPTSQQPMIRDLMELDQRIQALQIPSLAPKPRPTSFLTGNETVRTSEIDATEWQLGIPSYRDVCTASRVAQFLESYEKEECLLDLTSLVGWNRLELKSFASGGPSPGAIAECHRPIVESLVECGDDVTVQGYLTTSAADLDRRRQVLILEQQRQFLVVFRGTPAEQQGKFKPSDLVPMADVKVFEDPLNAVQELESALFSMLDKLTEDNPFYDVIFAGHAYGAAMATLASYRTAVTRPELRVAAMVTASPKVGAADFKLAVHSLPNLNVTRIEYGPARPVAPAGVMVGHTIRIHSSVGTGKQVPHPVQAYKFSDASEAAGRSLFKREKDVSDYVEVLEALNTWVQDYYRQDGEGVKGKDNEARQMA